MKLSVAFLTMVAASATSSIGLPFYNYPGVGERQRDMFHYSQAVRIGDRIELSGQGGWNPDTFDINSNVTAQVDQAFANVELALKTAGGEGWGQVFRVRSYHAAFDTEASDAMVRNFKKYMPDHEPLWTSVGVARLGEKAMKVEIEAIAYDP